MLIVSKFRDYYDSIKSFGVDKTVVYNRNTEYHKLKSLSWKEERNNKYSMSSSEEYTRKSFEFTFHKYVVGFCGNFFPLIQAKINSNSSNFYEQTHTFFDYESLKAFLDLYALKPTKYASYWSKEHGIGQKDQMAEFFNPKTWDFMKDDFYKYQTPVFILGNFKHDMDVNPKSYIISNPYLGDFEFYKAKHSVTAFQELYMYISGVLGVPAKPMVEISDKKLAEKRGHGDKYSFRKPPGKRGKNRWR